jgi:hypothetical protein
MAPARGRPPKFGRPASLVSFTLPNDVLDELRAITPDVGRAIVTLVERARQSPSRRQATVADLVRVNGRHSTLVVDPRHVSSLQGVSTIPLSADRALLALEAGASLADLELAVIERLEHADTQPDEREYLVEFRRLIRGWRADKHLRFSARSIVLAVRTRPVSGRSARPLATDKPFRKTLVAPASHFATLGVSRRPR